MGIANLRPVLGQTHQERESYASTNRVSQNSSKKQAVSRNFLEDALKDQSSSGPTIKAGEILLPVSITGQPAGPVLFLLKGQGLDWKPQHLPVPRDHPRPPVQCTPPGWFSSIPPRDARNPSLLKSWMSQATCHFHDFHDHTKTKMPTPPGRPVSPTSFHLCFPLDLLRKYNLCSP